MFNRSGFPVLVVSVLLAVVTAQCVPATPEVVEKIVKETVVVTQEVEVVVTKEVQVEVTPEAMEAGPLLVFGAFATPAFWLLADVSRCHFRPPHTL